MHFFVRATAPLLALHRGLAELLLPATCAACRALTDEDEPLCELCACTLDAIDRACARCGLPLSGEPARCSIAGESVEAIPHSPPICLGCLRAQPPWRRAAAPWAFTGELAAAIRRWKLGPDPGVTRPLARLLAPSLTGFADADAFVPVPLHPRRLRWREFNQASLLVREARARAPRGLPPVAEWLDRIRDTPPQATLDAAARRANMRAAFAVPPRARERVRGATLCLVDDVLTTGATASACVRALLAAGAASVDVLTLARALP